MVLRKLVGLLACTLILGTSFAMAGVPDLQESTAALATGGTTLVLYNQLDGFGNSFLQAKDINGDTYDATITLTVRDGAGAPVVNYPAEDMWLLSRDGLLVPCPNGTAADFNTDTNGETTWATPLAAGGYSEDLCLVVINGDALTSTTGLDLMFNSPDLDGNLDVGLSDLDEFVSVYFGSYSIKADLDYNNDIGLSDLDTFVDAYFNSGPCAQ